MIAAVIPLKRLRDAKSRLAHYLGVDDRARLARSLVEHTVEAMRASSCVDCIALVTPETALADELGLCALPDRGSLNDSLAEGGAWAQRIGAAALLVVPADLPLLSGDDIQTLIRAAPAPPGIAVAPTHDGGTGALLLVPPGIIPFAFGAGSFLRHCASAAERGLSTEVVRRDAFALDLDTTDDLTKLESWRYAVGRTNTARTS